MFNCYGNYSNRTLMTSYGFCFPNNHFESVTVFLVVTDTTPKTDIDEMVRLLPPFRKKMLCQYARLKTDQLSDKLLYFLRSVLRPHADTLLTRPTSIEMELAVFSKYNQVLAYLLQLLEEDTTLEQDLKLMEHEKNFNMLMGIVYRSERKRIIHSQIHLVHMVTAILTACQSPLT